MKVLDKWVQIRRALLSGSAALGILAGPAWAQQAAASATLPGAEPPTNGEVDQSGAAEPSDTGTSDEIVVRGIRRSLANAIRTKRNAEQIVDSISAEDIGKLPDQNIAESLQRVTGVQISRSNGQGSGVAIRGLTQIRYELNGATLTGNGTGRNVSFEAIPSELFAELQVYKSPSADIVEGGLGGTINLVTRKPLDLDPLTITGSAQQGYSDFRSGYYPRLSGLVSSRWDTGIGRIGALLNVSYDELALRSDEFDVLAWDRTGFGDIDGDGVASTAASGALTPDEVWRARQLRQVSQTQDRQRIGAVGTLQWQPAGNLELMLTGTYNKFKYRNDYRLLRIDVNNTRAATTAFERADNGTLLAASVRNANVLTNNFVEPTDQINYTGQMDVDWKPTERLRLTAKGNFARGRTDVPLVVYPTLVSNSTIPLSYDFGADAPIPTISTGFDFGNLANYKLNTVVPQTRNTRNDEDALRADAHYDLSLGIVKAVQFGARYGERTLSQENDDSLSNRFQNTPVTTANATLFPGAYTGELSSGQDFLSGVPGSVPRSWAGYASDFVNSDRIYELLSGVGLNLPVRSNISTYFTVKETTWAGYGKVDLGGTLGSMDWSLNAGLRMVHTRSDSYAFLPDTAGALTYQNQPNNYTDWLPSANAKLDLTDALTLRLAAAKVIARPAADQLKASTTINYGFQTASAGNPFLDPFRAKQADVSLEWYFRPGDLISVAAFYKDVSAFISNEVVNITIVNPEFPGQDQFRLSRPANGRSGKIKGFEVGFQHSFAELPGLLSGLGVQANYTFIDSTTPNTDPFTGDTLPLEGLSKNSYNLVGFYEKYGLSVRAAYNWRERYLTGTVAGSPIFSASVGQLDASASYDVNDRFTVTFEAVNLNNVRNRTYQSTEERLLSYVQYGRQFLGGVRFRF